MSLCITSQPKICMIIKAKSEDTSMKSIKIGLRFNTYTFQRLKFPLAPASQSLSMTWRHVFAKKDGAHIEGKRTKEASLLDLDRYIYVNFGIRVDEKK